MTTRRIGLFMSLLVSCLLAGQLQAFQADPPGRAARLNYYEGSLSFRPASLDDWTPVNRNYPLTIGDEVWAENGSRGEIHVGRATVLRLGPRTAFSFLNLDDDTTQVRVTEGSLTLTVSRLDDDEVVEVDTPNAAIWVLRPGFYRVDVDEQRYETRVTVRQGEAEVLAGGGALPLGPGQALLISGDDSDPRYDLRDAYARDSWEEWSLERDRREERFESRRYVSDYMVGYEDLDEYGRWSDNPDYGRVWMPRNVAADWAPYRDGHWAWVQPWGWTWIDDAPWGFAPFHYGRWARFDNGWGWLPGSSQSRLVYAPALVAFLDDLSLSAGGTGLGWVPLGPRDAYVPWYQASPGYIRSVNQPYVPNFTVINPANIPYNYVHLNTPGAVTAVNPDVFVAGRHVARAAMVVPSQQPKRARIRSTVVESLKPRRESIVGAAAAQASAPRPPAKVRQRPVVARMSPPPPPKRLFGEGQSAPAPQVRPAAREGQATKLRPAREGLPAPRAIRPGEWRRREPGREPERAREQTSPPAAEPPQRELPKAREPQREPERETPPATRPDAPKPPGAQPREPDDARKREQPPAASPAPVEPRREPAKPQDRARDPRQPSRESPPAARPDAPKPPSDDLKERARQQERSRERPAASPAPAAQPKEPKPEDRERDRRQRSREKPAAQPEASKPPAASPSPVAQPTEPAKPQDKAREQRSPDRVREKDKAKGKATPKPTPTPTPEAEGRR